MIAFFAAKRKNQIFGLSIQSLSWRWIKRIERISNQDFCSVRFFPFFIPTCRYAEKASRENPLSTREMNKSSMEANKTHARMNGNGMLGDALNMLCKAYLLACFRKRQNAFNIAISFGVQRLSERRTRKIENQIQTETTLWLLSYCRFAIELAHLYWCNDSFNLMILSESNWSNVQTIFAIVLHRAKLMLATKSRINVFFCKCIENRQKNRGRKTKN